MMSRGEDREAQTGRRGGKQGKPASERRVWVLEQGKNLQSVQVQFGLNDNRYVEVVGGGLKEGDDVVIGSLTAENGTAVNPQTNPFAPRAPGGPGRGRGF